MLVEIEVTLNVKLIAYIDDIVIVCSEDRQDIIQEASRIISKYGMKLNADKCLSLSKDSKISFVG